MNDNEEYKEKYNDNIEIEGLQLEGRNAVLEAINSGKQIDKIWLKKGGVDGTLKVIKAKAHEFNIVVIETDKKKLDFMAKSHNHQGVICICPFKPYVSVDDILDFAKSKNEDPFIIILDGITDTHNLGAILRTADICGAHGIIIPKRRAATLTGMVAKTSQGAINYVNVARVTNINTTISQLKEKGIWIYGSFLEGEACFSSNMKGPIGLVIGDEGKGISKLTENECDLKVSIPMYGNISSLNASVAASILMYEVVRQRNY